MAAAGLIDTRTVGRLSDFSGAPDQWLEWSFRARAWLALLQVAGTQPGDMAGMLAAAEAAAAPLDEGAFTPAATACSTVLFNVLAQVVRGKALNIIRQPPRGWGLESWRRLCREYEPDTGTRYASVLVGIIKP